MSKAACCRKMSTTRFRRCSRQAGSWRWRERRCQRCTDARAGQRRRRDGHRHRHRDEQCSLLSDGADVTAVVCNDAQLGAPLPRGRERASLFCMKSAARLLLLVALLLPFRGVLASTGLLCHMGGSSPATVVQGHEPGDRGDARAVTGYHQHGDETDPASEDHVRHGANDDVPRGATGTAGSASMCDLCSSVCAAPALPSHSAQLVVLLPATGERFPAVSPPRVAPTLGGLERPPRSF